MRTSHPFLIPVDHPECGSPAGEVLPEDSTPAGHYRLLRCPKHGLSPWMTRERFFICCENEKVSQEVPKWLH